MTIRPSQVNRLHKMHLQTKREARLIRSDIGLKFVDTDYECSSDSDMDEMQNRITIYHSWFVNGGQWVRDIYTATANRAAACTQGF